MTHAWPGQMLGHEQDSGPDDYLDTLINMNRILFNKPNSVALVRKRAIPTERPPLVGDVDANFCG
jgi:hypothetical protein